MARNPDVLVQIQKVDALLQSSGVRNYCLDCIARGRGCCQDCPSLGPDGCTDKPLSCALWLCQQAKQKFPEAQNDLSIISQRWPLSVAHGFRQRSIEAETTL